MAAAKNRLNDLSNKDWLKFQKSWFVHNPPPRKKNVLRHPAKFPENLVQEFIEFFTRRGALIFDPMVGMGSTLVAALRSGRHSIGVEINPEYAELARQVVAEEKADIGPAADDLIADVVCGDAARLCEIGVDLPGPIDYLITSPPYWDMLHAKGAATQKKSRDTRLDVVYSDDPRDLGNIHDYEQFISALTDIYASLKPLLRDGAYLTIIVKNVKKGGRMYPLAWDLATRLSRVYALRDEKIWCADNQPLFPYGLGTSSWVSNTFHTYCVQFRNE